MSEKDNDRETKVSRIIKNCNDIIYDIKTVEIFKTDEIIKLQELYSDLRKMFGISRVDYYYQEFERETQT